MPLAGKEYVSKVSENCVAYLKTVGTYSDEEEKAVAKFIEAFQDQHFPPGASVFYRQSPKGTLSVSKTYIMLYIYKNIFFFMSIFLDDER